MKARQTGAGLLVAVLLIATVAAFAVIVAASQSGADIHGNDAHADSIQALYLAETGVERALKRFATGTACAALAEVINDLSSLQVAGATVNILAGLATDFNGVALAAAQTQCRVRVTATINASNVSRTIHAIVDRNLLEGPDNPTFDNPLTGATPSGWTGINPAQAFAANGGQDGTAPNCRRSAWTARNNPAPAAQDRRATASANVQVAVNPGSVTRIDFYRRVITRTANCGGGALPPAGPALPGACAAGGADSTVCFQLVGTGGPGIWTVNSNAAPVAGPGGGACPTTFNPCSTSYGAKVQLNVNMPGATSVTQVIYWLQLQNVGRKEIFVDHIEVTNPTAVGAGHVKLWRDCSTAADPVNCT